MIYVLCIRKEKRPVLPFWKCVACVEHHVPSEGLHKSRDIYQNIHPEAIWVLQNANDSLSLSADSAADTLFYDPHLSADPNRSFNCSGLFTSFLGTVPNDQFGTLTRTT